jgi:hypothetical protein
LKLLFVLLVMVGVAGADTGGGIEPLAGLRLADQYGELHSLGEHRGQVVVVMVVSAKRLRNIKPWERRLRERFDELHYLRIADVPADSKAARDAVASKLIERVPEGVSVLIDMDRQWADQLGLDTARPNLLIVDPEGSLVASFRGLHSPQLEAAVIHHLERLLERP